MDLSRIIFRPVLTEKSLIKQKENVWTFLVDSRANKDQIRLAIKKYFGVDPVKVRIVSMAPKTKMLWRFRRRITLGREKKALVTLKSGDKIKELLVKEKNKTKA